MTRRRQLALFGAEPLFDSAKPTGNLYRPNIEAFLDYSRAFFTSKHYSNHSLCRLLEERLADFHGVERVVIVDSGFWGHVLAMRALGVPGKSEVIVPSFGYRRSDDMIAWAGYTPHFCDVDPETLGISVEAAKAELSDRTALILAPHPMVCCCEAAEIENFGRSIGIPVVFDSVEAAYRIYSGKRIGGFGDAEVFSMHSTKLLNGFEGGYIATNDVQLADELEKLKLVDDERRSDTKMLYSALPEMHAALALAALDEVDKQVGLNRRKYELYLAGLRQIEGITLLDHKEDQRPDYRLIVVRLDHEWPLSRENTLRALEAERVLARAYYTPLHKKTVEFDRVCPPLPVTEALYPRLLVFPSGAHVSDDDVEQIIDLLTDIRRRAPEIDSFLKAQ